MSYLYEYEEINGGYVAFGGDPKRENITGKEKFEGSSKNLSRLLDSQQSDKSKTGLVYDSQGVDSQVLENQVKTVNEDVRLQALVDGKKVIVNEASIIRDLRLDDIEGTACLANAAIFEELPRMGGEDIMQLNELMEICTKLSDGVLSLEQIKTNQAARIEKLKKKVKKLEGMKKKRTHGLKRLYKVGLSTRVESSEEEEGLGDQEDASKQGRSIADIDLDEGTTLVDDTQGRMNDQDMFRVNDLSGDEVIVDVSARKKGGVYYDSLDYY
nr:hypothetical protein [Tanacetum cinerariifolium]